MAVAAVIPRVACDCILQVTCLQNAAAIAELTEELSVRLAGLLVKLLQEAGSPCMDKDGACPALALQAIKAAESMAQAYPDASDDLIAQLGTAVMACGEQERHALYCVLYSLIIRYSLFNSVHQMLICNDVACLSCTGACIADKHKFRGRS